MEKNMREINPGLSAEIMTKPEAEIITESELAKRIIEKINDFLKERQINGVEIKKISNKDVLLKDTYNLTNITLDPNDPTTLTTRAACGVNLSIDSRSLQETITRLGLCAELPRKVAQGGYQVFLGDMDSILYEGQLKEIKDVKDKPEKTKIFEDRFHITCALRIAFAKDKDGSLSQKMEQIKNDALNDLKKYAAQFIATSDKLSCNKDQVFKISAPDMADYNSRDPQLNFFNLGPHLTPPINLSESGVLCNELPPLMGLRGKAQKQADNWVGEKCIYTDEHFRLDDILYPHLEKILDLIKIDEEVKKRYLGYRVDSYQGRRNPQEKNIYSDLDINPLTQERIDARKNANDYLVKTIEMIRKQNKIPGLDKLSNTQVINTISGLDIEENQEPQLAFYVAQDLIVKLRQLARERQEIKCLISDKDAETHKNFINHKAEHGRILEIQEKWNKFKEQFNAFFNIELRSECPACGNKIENLTIESGNMNFDPKTINTAEEVKIPISFEPHIRGVWGKGLFDGFEEVFQEAVKKTGGTENPLNQELILLELQQTGETIGKISATATNLGFDVRATLNLSKYDTDKKLEAHTITDQPFKFLRIKNQRAIELERNQRSEENRKKEELVKESLKKEADEKEKKEKAQSGVQERNKKDIKNYIQSQAGASNMEKAWQIAEEFLTKKPELLNQWTNGKKKPEIQKDIISYIKEHLIIKIISAIKAEDEDLIKNDTGDKLKSISLGEILKMWDENVETVIENLIDNDIIE